MQIKLVRSEVPNLVGNKFFPAFYRQYHVFEVLIIDWCGVFGMMVWLNKIPKVWMEHCFRSCDTFFGYHFEHFFHQIDGLDIVTHKQVMKIAPLS